MNIKILINIIFPLLFICFVFQHKAIYTMQYKSYPSNGEVGNDNLQKKTILNNPKIKNHKTNEESYTCSLCVNKKKIYLSFKGFKNHLLKFHNVPVAQKKSLVREKLICSTCNKHFYSLDNYYIHVNYHDIPYPKKNNVDLEVFSCPICSQNFYIIDDYRIHISKCCKDTIGSDYDIMFYKNSGNLESINTRANLNLRLSLNYSLNNSKQVSPQNTKVSAPTTSNSNLTTPSINKVLIPDIPYNSLNNSPIPYNSSISLGKDDSQRLKDLFSSEFLDGWDNDL